MPSSSRATRPLLVVPASLAGGRRCPRPERGDRDRPRSALLGRTPGDPPAVGVEREPRRELRVQQQVADAPDRLGVRGPDREPRRLGRRDPAQPVVLPRGARLARRVARAPRRSRSRRPRPRPRRRTGRPGRGRRTARSRRGPSPVSSCTSRIAAIRTRSPGSTPPVTHCHRPGKIRCGARRMSRISRRSASGRGSPGAAGVTRNSQHSTRSGRRLTARSVARRVGRRLTVVRASSAARRTRRSGRPRRRRPHRSAGPRRRHPATTSPSGPSSRSSGTKTAA